MPTVISGQNYDLQDTTENIAKYLIRNRWNLQPETNIPARDEITFSNFGWSGRKSYQISVEAYTPPEIVQLNIGTEQIVRCKDQIWVHVYIIKNKDEVPPQMHFISQRIEEIVFENVINVGYGITNVKLISPFSSVELMTAYTGAFPNQVEISLWHSRATIELLYFRSTTGILTTVSKSKIHKYDIVIV